MDVILCHMGVCTGDQDQSNGSRMDYAYAAVNVKESQYGSWTKLSLVDSALLTNDPTTQEQAGNDIFQAGRGSEEEVTQFLTQPPSEQQDSIISK